MAQRPRFIVIAALTAIAAAVLALFGLDAVSTPRLPLVMKNGVVTQLPTGDSLFGSGIVPLPVACGGGSAIQGFDAVGNPTCIAAGGGGGGGTVTNVATGTGLTGGPITTTGTLSLAINAGTTQACTAGKAFTSMTGAGIQTCSSFSTFLNGAGTNVIPKSDGTNLVNSGFTDSGTNISTSELLSASGGLTVTGGETADAITTGKLVGTVAQDSTTNSSVNDYALAATTTYLVFTATTSPTLTGIAGGVDGRFLVITSANTSNTLTLANENASSLAANRIHAPGATNGFISNNSGGLLLMYDGTLSRWRVIESTNLPILTVQGAATLNSTLGVTGVSTLTKAIINGSTGNSSTIIGLSSTAQAANENDITATNTGTFNTTGGVLTAGGVNASVTATRSTGTNALTNQAGYFNASGAQTNQALFADAGDVVLNNTSGTTTIKGTTTDTGGATFTTASTATVPLQANNANTAQTVTGQTAIVSDSGTYNTTAGTLIDTALSVANTSSRSAGANNLSNTGIIVTVSGGQTNTAINVTSGATILQNATISTTEFNGADIQVDGPIFTHNTAGVPTLSSCGASPAIDSKSSNTAGKVTMGAASTTSCLLTFSSAYANVPYCVCSSAGTTSTEALVSCVPATGTLTFNATSATSAGIFDYVCIGGI